ncbi:hypothetical protein ACOMHN_034518 [Nucella lapillus]
MDSIEDSKKCQYNYLGKSGLRVSNICLGALTFGKSSLGLPGQLDEAGSHQLINRFVEWGGNFIDTANIYGMGESERIVGTWLAGQERDRFVIATKAFFRMDSTNPIAIGLNRRHLIHSVESSLERLQTSHIPQLSDPWCTEKLTLRVFGGCWTHAWDDVVTLEETVRTLEDLVRCGKVRYLGACNLSGWQIQKIVDLTERMGCNPFASLQQQYSLMCRESEWEAFRACKLNGVGVLPWSPLKGGFLTDRMMQQQQQRPVEGRLGKAAEDEEWGHSVTIDWSQINNCKSWDILHTTDKVAKAKDKSIAQVSLRWLLQQPAVSSVIIGVTKLSQLEDNMAAANGWQLTPEEMQELDEISKPVMPYPYSLYNLPVFDK